MSTKPKPKPTAFTRAVGAALKAAREERGFSKRGVADDAGITSTTVARVEEGHGCTVVTLVQLCAALQLRAGNVINDALRACR